MVLSDIKRGADAAVLCSRETCGRRQATAHPALGKRHVEEDIKKSTKPIINEYDRVHASTFAHEVTSAAVFVRSVYFLCVFRLFPR